MLCCSTTLSPAIRSMASSGAKRMSRWRPTRRCSRNGNIWSTYNTREEGVLRKAFPDSYDRYSMIPESEPLVDFIKRMVAEKGVKVVLLINKFEFNPSDRYFKLTEELKRQGINVYDILT